MISILIPTYSEDVNPLVRALLQQADKLSSPYEIRVLNDGYPGYTPLIKELASHPKVHFTSRTTNEGRAATRQQLAQAAQFKYVLFLDADVLPVQTNFLTQYMEVAAQGAQVCCGGLAYQEEAPGMDQRLRYVYGREREAVPAAQRQKTPHLVLAGNLMMERDLFLQLNSELEHFYGDDLVLSQNLKNQGIAVTHIDNPVFHLGLENALLYLDKSLKAIESIVRLEKSGRLSNDLTRLQQVYKNKRWAIPLIRTWVRIFRKTIISNLTSGTPNLLWFDLYRLDYYAKLKKHA